MDDKHKLSVDSKDATLAIILDVIVSMLLRSAVSTPVYIASMFALVILSAQTFRLWHNIVMNGKSKV